MTTTKTTDAYWSKLYDNGRDFSLITADMVTKFLTFTLNDSTKKCLDIGCGTGQLTRELYHRGYRCVGIDASKSGIKIANSLSVVSSDKLLYQQFDIEYDALSNLPEQKFSLITCKLVYAFIQDKPGFIRRVRQLLNPRGSFVVITPHVNDVPKERRHIAISDEQLHLLSDSFANNQTYKGPEQVSPLTYFVGQKV